MMSKVFAWAALGLALTACGDKPATQPAAAPTQAASAAVPSSAEVNMNASASNKAEDGWLAEAQKISREIVQAEDPAAAELLLQAGGLPPAGRYSYTVNLKAGQYYTFFADCDYDCSNIDLELKNAGGQVMAKDFETDDAPMFGFRPQEAGTYSVDVVMSTCEDRECRFSSQVFEGTKDVF